MIDSTHLHFLAQPIKAEPSAERPAICRTDESVNKAAHHEATAFAGDVITEVARGFPFVTLAAAKMFADGVIGMDLHQTFPSPYPERTWHDEAFKALNCVCAKLLQYAAVRLPHTLLPPKPSCTARFNVQS